MSVYTVRAAQVEELDSLGVFCVALAEDESGEGMVLTFAVPTSGYSEEDRRLGQDTYSISDAMGRIIYGGVVAWKFDAARSRLLIEFTAEASKLFSVDREVEFEIDVPELSFEDLLTGLARVLDIEGAPL
jgi:hypothetical protein